MIITENLENGLARRYSDSGMMLRQIGTNILYSEAVDITPHAYEETDIPVDGDEDITADEVLSALEAIL